MAKIYKHSNPYIKKLSLMFMARISFVVISAALIFLIVWFIGKQNLVATVVMSFFLVSSVILFFVISGYYDILLSGYKGEKKLGNLIRYLRTREKTVIFTNLPIEYGKRRSELDMLVINTGGVFIIEAKNHSGVISGNGGSEKWSKTSNKKGGQSVKYMDNPFRQTRRQRDILKSILSAGGCDCRVNEIVYFTSEYVFLNLSLDKGRRAFSNEQALLKYITTGGNILSRGDINKITQALIG